MKRAARISLIGLAMVCGVAGATSARDFPHMLARALASIERVVVSSSVSADPSTPAPNAIGPEPPLCQLPPDEGIYYTPAGGEVYTAPATVSVEINTCGTEWDNGHISVELICGNSSWVAGDDGSLLHATFNGISKGSCNITYRAFKTGVTAWEATASFSVVSAHPPSVSIVAPEDGKTFFAPTTLDIVADASDTDGSVASVEFFSNGASILFDTVAPFSATLTNPPVGDYEVTARAIDNTGGTSDSTAVHFKIEPALAPPTVSLISPANPSVYSAPATVLVQANAASGDGSPVRVEFLRNGTSVGFDASPPFETALSGLAVGEYDIAARVMDRSGALSTSTAHVTVNPVANPITLSITSPTNGASIIVPAPINFSVALNDPNHSVTSVVYAEGPTTLATSTTAPFGFAWPGATPGPHSVSARAFSNGIAVTPSSIVTIQAVQDEAPTVTLAPQAAAPFPVGPATILLTATAGDTDGTVMKVDFLLGSSVIGTDTTAPYSVTWANVAGSATAYTVIARAVDNNNVSRDSSAAFKVDNNAAPHMPDMVTPTTPSFVGPRTTWKWPKVYQQHETMHLVAHVEDDNGNVSKVQFFGGVRGTASLLGTAYATTPNQQDFTFDVGQQGVHLAEGPNPKFISAVATDTLGAVSMQSVEVPIAVVADHATRIPCGGPMVADTGFSTDPRPLLRCAHPGGTGALHQIPGVVQAERFDDGGPYDQSTPGSPISSSSGQGVGYFDIDGVLVEQPWRSPYIDVACPGWPDDPFVDACYVRNLKDGEWLEYSIHVNTAGLYHITQTLAAVSEEKTGESPSSSDVQPATETVVSLRSTMPGAKEQIIKLGGASPRGAEGINGATADPKDLGLTDVDLLVGDYIMGVRVGGPTNLDSITLGLPGATPPVLRTRIITPQNGSVFARGTNVLLASTVTGAIASTTVEYFANGVSVGPVSPIPTEDNPTATLTWTPQASITYTLTARARNGTGTPGPLSDPVTVSVNDNIAPTVRLLAPGVNTTINLGETYRLVASANDPDGTILSTEFLMNGLSANPSLVMTAPPYTRDWTPTQAGTYQITVRATDNHGAVNVSTPAVALTVLDNTVPSAGLATPTAPSFASVPASDPNSEVVGATAGEFRVNEGGNATYSVPLFTMPGVAGLSPKLSLSYASGNGDGYLGVGWAIDGLQSIMRCRRSREAGDALVNTGIGLNARYPFAHTPLRFHDGVSDQDEYCLNGQRLIKVAGTHGQAGAEYRTELDGFARVTITDDSGTANVAGPEQFTVEGKDGTKLTFGGRLGNKINGIDQNSNARVPVNNADNGYYYPPNTSQRVINTWAQSRTEDSAGNTIDYFYDYGSGDTSGEQYIREIHYTGRASGSPLPQSWIGFEYEDVAASVSFASGMQFKRSHRLSRIDVHEGASVVRSYLLRYDNNDSPLSGRARLLSLQECTNAAGTTCYPRTRFDWFNGALGVNSAASTTQPGEVFHDTAVGANALDDVSAVKFGDINGDSRADMVWVKDHRICWSIASASGFSYTTSCPGTIELYKQPVSAGDDIYADASLAYHLYDFNSDGRDDLLVARRNATNWEVYLSNGAGFFAPGSSAGIRTSGTGELQLADYNGDGLLDAMYGVAQSGSSAPATGKSFSDPGLGTVPVVSFLARSGTGGITCAVGLTWCFSQTGTVANAPATAVVRFIGYTIICNGTNAPISRLPLPFEGGMDVMDFDGDGANDIRAKVVWPNLQECGNGAAAWVVFRNIGFTTDDVQNPKKFATFERIAEFPIGSQSGDIETPPFNAANPVESRDYRFITADLNGDGLADFVYRKKTSSGHSWVYRLNTGRVSPRDDGHTGWGLQLAPEQPIAVLNALSPAPQEKSIQILDYDGDGDADIVYGLDGTVRQFYLVRWTGAGGFATTGTVLTNVLSNTGQNSERSTFVDLDGDGRADQALIDYEGGGAGNTEVILRRAAKSASGHRYEPSDVIGTITNGLGAKTVIAYSPLTVAATYSPGDKTDDPTHTYGRGSHVSDLHGAAYVVREAASSAPIASNPNGMARISYRYRGARMQAGGRGYLGFEEVQSLDWQTSIEASTVYDQSFPYVGMPASSSARWLSGGPSTDGWSTDSLTTRCLADPDGGGCFAYAAVGGRAWPTPAATTSTTLHTGYDLYGFVARGAGGYPATIVANAVPAALPSVATPLFVYKATATSTDYEVNTAEATRTNVSALGTYDAYGNLLTSASSVKNGADSSIKTVATEHRYGPTDDDRRLGRLIYTKVTTLLPATGNQVVRETAFHYKAGIRLLDGEVVDPNNNGAADRGLVTAYEYDAYGNRIKTTTCAAADVGGTSNDALVETAVNACRNTSVANVIFAPTGATSIRRYSRVEMDTDRRYVKSEFSPFSSNPGAVEVQTSIVEGRNVFGSPTQASDANGGTGRFGYDAFGRKFFQSSNAGGWSKTTMRYCAGAVPSLDQLGLVTPPASQACPSGAKFVVETTGAGAPKHWSYMDLLGREVLSVGQGYRTTDYVAAVTQYDLLGRVTGKSVPTTTGSATALPSSSQNIQTAYDNMGRVRYLVGPDGATTETVYGTLTATVTPPLNKNNLRNIRVETRNALGEIISVKDSQDLYVCYAYWASGEMAQMRQQSVSCANSPPGAVTTTMTYDNLGRKTMMVDPDKGTWSYGYNAAGEQIKEINARGGCTLSFYDGRGRLQHREDYRAGNCTNIEHATQWTFDSRAGAAVARGGLSTETVSVDGTTLQTKLLSYDSLGRAVKVDTTIEGRTYTSRSTFDEFGRAFQELFKSPEFQQETGVLYEYTDSFSPGNTNDDAALNEGFYRRIRDAFGGRTGAVHQEVFEVNAFGNVTRERHAGSTALETTRQYDLLTGRLKAISTNNGLVQSWTYDWDQAGNLMWRRDRQSNPQLANYEQFDYDALNRLKTVTKGEAPSPQVTTMSLTYDASGDILSRSGAVYAYGGTVGAACTDSGVTAPGPHAVASLTQGTVTNYCYDASGNQLRAYTDANNWRTVKYTVAEQASEISSMVQGTPGATIRFSYGAGRERIRRVDYASASPTNTVSVTHYVGPAEVIQTVRAGCSMQDVTVRREYAGMVINQRRSVAAGTCATATSERRDYRLVDQLGSTDALVNAAGAPSSVDSGQNVGQQRFDAFGMRRAANDWSLISATALFNFDTQLTRKGFTGHEQLDTSGLVHMNGRVYDPRLGRFIQADPVIQSPFDAQSLNRYTYVFNNPLAYTDPTGFSADDPKWIQWVMTAVSIYVTIQTGGATAGLMSTGAVSEAAFVTTAGGFAAGMAGSGTIKGGLQGAFTNLVTFGAGQLTTASSIAGSAGGRFLINGAAGGVLECASGGNFGHGFIKAGIGQVLNANLRFDNAAIEGVAQAVIGGTVSRVAGGKFANGAASAAFNYAVHYAVGSMMSRSAGATDAQTAQTGMAPRDFNEKVGQLRNNGRILFDAKKIAIGRIESYCASGADCSEVNVTAFEKMRFRFSGLDFSRDKQQGSLGTITGENSPDTVGIVDLFPGALVISNKASPPALAGTLIHEFIHDTPTNLAKSRAYWASGVTLDWAIRPQESHAIQLEQMIR